MNDIIYSVEEIRYNEGGYNSTGYSANKLFENEDDAIAYIEDICIRSVNTTENFAIGKWIRSGNHFDEIEMKHVYCNGKRVNEEYSNDLSKFIHD